MSMINIFEGLWVWRWINHGTLFSFISVSGSKLPTEAAYLYIQWLIGFTKGLSPQDLLQTGSILTQQKRTRISLSAWTLKAHSQQWAKIPDVQSEAQNAAVI